MKDELLKEIYALKDDLLGDLRKIVQIRSVKGPPKEGAPFGTGPKEALIEILHMARRMGFETKMVANAVGYLQFGTGHDYIGIVGHLDVVPEGDVAQWDYPPFEMSQKQDMLYGRGVLDNKGPTMSCLYALYVLKKLGLSLSKPIRLIFGTDEESGAADIPMYLACEQPPVFGFTPDCKYPVVYGEMGYLNVTIINPIVDGSHGIFEHFEIDANVSKIPDKLYFSLKGEEMIRIMGKSAPTNAPNLADNVILKFATRLHELADGEFGVFLSWLTGRFNQAGTGAGFGFNQPVMPVPYDIRIGDSAIELDVVIRYDIKLTQAELLEQIRSQMNQTYRIKVNRAMPSMRMDVTLPEIQIMREVYESVTGLDGTPVITTGATYARWIPNVVAFGPSFPGQKGIAHLPNEWMKVSDLMKNFEIYTLTMYELAK